MHDSSAIRLFAHYFVVRQLRSGLGDRRISPEQRRPFRSLGFVVLPYEFQLCLH